MLTHKSTFARNHVQPFFGILLAVTTLVAPLAHGEDIPDEKQQSKPSGFQKAKQNMVLTFKVFKEVCAELISMGIDPVGLAKDAAKDPGQFRVQVPEHDRKRIILFSTQDDDRICQSALENWDTSPDMFYQNAEDEKRVRAIAERIVAILPAPAPEIRIRLRADDSINAACTIGGALLVNRGTLRQISDDNLIAAIIAHEFGHASARHSSEGLTKLVMKTAIDTYGTEKLAQVCDADSNSAKYKWIGAVCGIGTTYGFALPYDRKMEFEADRLGTLYLKRAGYPPEAMVQLFEFFLSLEGNAASPRVQSLLSTHPATADRLEEVQKIIQAELP